MNIIRTVGFKTHNRNKSACEYVLEIASPNIGGVKNVFKRFGLLVRDAIPLNDEKITHRIFVKAQETSFTPADSVLDAANEVLEIVQGYKEITRERISPQFFENVD